MPKKENLTNQIFGLVQCISPAESRSGKTYWNCKCIKCGAEKIIQTTHLKDGRTKTCGCGCKIENFLHQEDVKICEICGSSFIGNNNRIYCYDCSPNLKECSNS